MPLRLNLGSCPRQAAGRRIRVLLVGGYDSAHREPQGWAADGRGGCNWSLDLGDFSIAEWELIG